MLTRMAVATGLRTRDLLWKPTLASLKPTGILWVRNIP